MVVAIVVNNDGDACASQELKCRYCKGSNKKSDESIGSVGVEEVVIVEEVKFAMGEGSSKY
jgi:hypothetical protein